MASSPISGLFHKLVVPSITYTDLQRAVDWLHRVFGFRERADARLTWPGGGMTWIEIGNGLINISTPDESWRQTPGAGFVMKVYVDDVDNHFARAKAEGAKIVSEPQDGFWGGSNLQNARSREPSLGDLAARTRFSGTDSARGGSRRVHLGKRARVLVFSNAHCLPRGGFRHDSSQA